MKEIVGDKLPKRINQIEFGIFSAQEAKKLSVLELHEKDLYDINSPKRPPTQYGVLDRRMGTTDKQEKCATCFKNMQNCVGHFGVVRLALPVFHIGYFKLMNTILQNICKICSRLLLDDATKRIYQRRIRNPAADGLQRKETLKSLNTLCKKGTVKKVGALKVIHDRFKKKKTEEEVNFRASFQAAAAKDSSLKPHLNKAQDDLSPLTVLRILERISDEDCEVMGLDPVRGRPELFLWTAIPVPPVCIRPSVGQEDASNEDDLTVLVSDIIQSNTEIKTLIRDGKHTVSKLMEHWDYLQLQCAMYVTSDLPGVPNHLQSNLQKIKRGFCQRLKGKHGRFRGNLSGKRVDFSGRTVISPDPNLRIDQVAVPERIARILTYPERVTTANRERLKCNVQKGPDELPGAVYVQSKNGMKRFLRFGDRNKIAEDLKIGDIVERHLQDGDIVLFNRQPSLHKLSIMSHFVKVRPWRTLRFNECVCTPYNADFDGDEMNLHVPQTEEARAEAQELMGVKNNLVTPRNGEPLIAATQDFITASYLLSKKDVFYDRAQFVQICSYMADATGEIEIPLPTILKPMVLWTGKQVFSVLLKPNSEQQYIINLETKCRTFDKPKKFAGTRLHPEQPDASMCKNDGYLVLRNSEIMSGVIDKSIIGAENKKSLFYTVLRDCGPVAAAACMNRVAKLSARWLANQGFSIGIDDVQPGEELKRAKEAMVEEGYAKCDSFIRMSQAGELPSQPGCTDEQTLEAEISKVLSKIRDDVGNICMTELNKYNAPLIMSLCGSKGSKINVSQMVAIVGQQIISGSRIPNGFLDRSLPHFPKNSKLPAAKGFVRNSFYSGLSPPEFFFHAVSGREGLVDTAVKTAETGYMQRRLMKALEDLTTHYDLSVRNSNGGVVQFTFGDDGLDPARIEGSIEPVEFCRNLLHSMALPHDDDLPIFAFEARKILEERESFMLESCPEAYVKSVFKFVEDAMISPTIALRRKLGLNTGEVEGVTEDRFALKQTITRGNLYHFLETCRQKYIKARIEPGTAVGAVGAQSIGEPGTQMTLKTFHFAGVASMNVTLGVPRIKEIINASKVIATPIMKAALVAKTSQDERAARVVKGRIEKTVLQDITEYVEEVIAPTECYIRIKIDIETVAKLQLELNLHSIAQSILRAPKLKIPESSIQVENPCYVRIRITSDMKSEKLEMLHALKALKRAIPQVVVNGIPTVNRAVITRGDGKTPGVHLLVEGYGLRTVMGTEGVNGLDTRSNHTLENWKTLGIEAARNTIIDEIVFTMQSHGMTIDRRHVMLLADLMTFKGEVLGITRFGIAKMKDSVLMLASFEKTTDHLFEASFFGKKDTINGVSECIIMGIPMGIGTGLFKLLQKTERKDGLLRTKGLVFDP